MRNYIKNTWRDTVKYRRSNEDEKLGTFYLSAGFADGQGRDKTHWIKRAYRFVAGGGTGGYGASEK